MKRGQIRHTVMAISLGLGAGYAPSLHAQLKEGFRQYYEQSSKLGHGPTPAESRQLKRSTVEPAANREISERVSRIKSSSKDLPLPRPQHRKNSPEHKAELAARNAKTESKRAAKLEAKKQGKKFDKKAWYKAWKAKKGQPVAGGKDTGMSDGKGGKQAPATGPGRKEFILDGSKIQREVEFGGPSKPQPK